MTKPSLHHLPACKSSQARVKIGAICLKVTFCVPSQATLAFTPLLVRKLDDWTADLLGLNGLDKIPASMQDCLNKLVATSTGTL